MHGRPGHTWETWVYTGDLSIHERPRYTWDKHTEVVLRGIRM
jgi:hypothetical protein